MKTRQGYSLLQIFLHWTIAALVVFQLLVHEGMEDAWDAREDGERIEPGDEAAAMLHIAVGVAILTLALIRIAVRLIRGAPPIPPQHPLPLRLIAGATHLALYAFIIVQPLTGAATWFLGIEDAGDIHSAAQFIVIPLIALHAAGGLAEHFVFKTDALKRMLKPERS